MEFTPRQLDAVSVDRPRADACVVAGPGSGKTTVLVEYFRRLVEAGADPLRILAITFTEKAASNMRGKLAEAFADDAERRGRLERAYVSTVHGFCARLLRENAIFAGIDPEFYVMDERESAREMGRAAAATLDGLLAERPDDARRLMRGLASPDIGGAMLGVYDAMRAAGIAVERLASYRLAGLPSLDDLMALVAQIRAHGSAGWSPAQRAALEEILENCERLRENPLGPFECKLNRLRRNNGLYELIKQLKELAPEVQRAALTEHYAPERAMLAGLLARFDSLHRERKRQLGALDYADLEEFAVRLLAENPEVRARISSQFDHVLMDEFQDTNGLQARLLELLRAPDCFYAVGDINQSIYGFRHAEPGVFRDYRDGVAANGKHMVELLENFRSRADILRAVETVMAGAPGVEPRALVPRREFAEKTEPSVELIAASAEESEAAQAIEAQWVARRILEFQARGARFKGMAVLVRNSEVLGGFAAAFDAAGIPYLVNRGKGFYETREIVDLSRLLRALVNPRDEIALAAVLRSPFVEISDQALLRLKQYGNLGGALRRLSESEAVEFDSEDWSKLRCFAAQLERWRARRDFVSPDRLLLTAIEETGYPFEPGSRAAANIEKFLVQAREAAARDTLAGFVADLETVRESNPREPEAPPEDSVDAVTVMTVHSAKGLEFPIVFVAALHKGFDQSMGALSFSPRIGLGARWRNPVTGEDKEDSFQHAIRAERRQREADESNRLFYVAMTRAEEHLVLSLAAARNWGEMVRDSLQVDLETPRDEVLTFANPAGEPWRLRVLCVNAPPAALARPAAPETAAPVEALARPAVLGQYESNATVTAVAAFGLCPRRYYLTHYLGWEGSAGGGEGRPGELSASEFGRQVHALLAGEAVDAPAPEAVELAERFHASPLGRRAAAAARAGREFAFLLAIADAVVRGQIDLWFEDAGELTVVDYKTDQVSAEEAAARAEGYALQLRLYALALQRLTGRAPAMGYVYLLRPDAAVPVAFDAESLAEAERTVQRLREAQENQAFPLREGAGCRKCPHYQRLCPAVL